MTYRELVELLKAVAPYIQQAHDDAERRHDEYGEDYMNADDWEIMLETEKLISEIAKAIKDTENT